MLFRSTVLTESKIIVSPVRFFDKNTDKTDKNLKSCQLCQFQKIIKRFRAFYVICSHCFCYAVTKPSAINPTVAIAKGSATSGPEVRKYSALVICVEAEVKITVSEYRQI